MSNPAHTLVRVMLRPDRRQDEGRRAQPRGGRRASDQPGFALSSTGGEAEAWNCTDPADWGPVPRKAYVH